MQLPDGEVIAAFTLRQLALINTEHAIRMQVEKDASFYQQLADQRLAIIYSLDSVNHSLQKEMARLVMSGNFTVQAYEDNRALVDNLNSALSKARKRDKLTRILWPASASGAFILGLLINR